MSETGIKKAITDALEAAGYIVTRTAAGGYRGRTKGCKKGTLDLHVQVNNGRACWQEVKKDDKEKPTKEQREFAERVANLGAYVACVHDISGAIDAARKAEMVNADGTWMYNPRGL
jgi:hypothetical protein